MDKIKDPTNGKDPAKMNAFEKALYEKYLK